MAGTLAKRGRECASASTAGVVEDFGHCHTSARFPEVLVSCPQFGCNRLGSCFAFRAQIVPLPLQVCLFFHEAAASLGGTPKRALQPLARPRCTAFCSLQFLHPGELRSPQRDQMPVQGRHIRLEILQLLRILDFSPVQAGFGLLHLGTDGIGLRFSLLSLFLCLRLLRFRRLYLTSCCPDLVVVLKRHTDSPQGIFHLIDARIDLLKTHQTQGGAHAGIIFDSGIGEWSKGGDVVRTAARRCPTPLY